MSLILHLMKKDARYLRYELAISVLLVLAQNGMVLSGLDVGLGHNRLDDLNLAYQFLLACQMVIAVVLAAQLVQSDPLTSTAAFWRTRPITRFELATSELAFAAGVALGIPFIVEFVTYGALGIGPAAAARAACTWLLFRALLLLPAMAGAGVTSNISRLVVLAIFLTVGLLVTQWTVVAVGRPFMVLRTLESTAGLQVSRFAVLYTLFIAFSLAAIVNQFLSLKTRRSVVLIAVGVVTSVVAMDMWRIDLTSRPQAQVDRSRIDPGQLAVSLRAGPLVSQTIQLGSGAAPEESERIYGRLSSAGLPGSVITIPLSVRGTLTWPGEAGVSSAIRSDTAMGTRVVSRLSDDRNRAILAAIGPIAWSDVESASGVQVASALIDVPASIAGRHHDEPATLSAEVTLEAIAFHTAGATPVVPGASYRRSPRTARITEITFEQNRCVITLRDVSLAADRQYNWRASEGQYLLVNRTTNEALFPDQTTDWPVFVAAWATGLGPHLSIVHEQLRFAPPPSLNGRPIDAAWLAKAELIRVEPESLGVFTKRLTVDRLHLSPPR